MFDNRRQLDDYLELARAIEEAPSVIACTNYPDAFFPEQDGTSMSEVRWAIQMCNECPVRQQCLEYGIRWETHGIWGGLTPKQRQQLRGNRAGVQLTSVRRRESRSGEPVPYPPAS